MSDKYFIHCFAAFAHILFLKDNVEVENLIWQARGWPVYACKESGWAADWIWLAIRLPPSLPLFIATSPSLFLKNIELNFPKHQKVLHVYPIVTKLFSITVFVANMHDATCQFCLLLSSYIITFLLIGQ